MARFLIYIGIAVTIVGTVGTGIYFHFFENNNESPVNLVQDIIQKEDSNQEIEKKEEIKEENKFFEILFIIIDILSIILSLFIIIGLGIIAGIIGGCEKKDTTLLFTGIGVTIYGIGTMIIPFFKNKIVSIVIFVFQTFFIIIFFIIGNNEEKKTNLIM